MYRVHVATRLSLGLSPSGDRRVECRFSRSTSGFAAAGQNNRLSGSTELTLSCTLFHSCETRPTLALVDNLSATRRVANIPLDHVRSFPTSRSPRSSFHPLPSLSAFALSLLPHYRTLLQSNTKPRTLVSPTPPPHTPLVHAPSHRPSLPRASSSVLLPPPHHAPQKMRTTFLLSLAFSTTILAKPQYPSRRQQQRLNIAQQQQQLVVPGSGSERAQGGVAGEGAGGGNTSGTSILPVIVHLVDPSSPSSPPSSSSSSDSDSSDSDSPNFGSPCTFTSTFTTCGDYYDETTGIDHGLFCSPTEETCAGLGAACGSSESCDEGALSLLSLPPLLSSRAR